MGHSLGGMISTLIDSRQETANFKYDGHCMLTPFFDLYDKSMIEKVRPLLQMMEKVTPDKMFPMKGSEPSKMHMKEWHEDHLNLGFSITPHNILQNDKAMKMLSTDKIFEK